MLEKTSTTLLTPFDELDAMMGGLQPGQFVLIASRPGMGATTFGLSIIQQLVADQHVPCAIFSPQVGQTQLLKRLAILISSDPALVAKFSTTGSATKLPLSLDATQNISLDNLQTIARKFHSDHDVRCIFVDGLQSLTVLPSQGTRAQTSAAASGLRLLARELDVPILATAYLHRASEDREGHLPRISDIYGSCAIEHEADTILLLHRDDYYHISEPYHPSNGITQVHVAKNRFGPTALTTVRFDELAGRFVPS